MDLVGLVRAHLEKQSPDVLRALVKTFAEAVMSAEAQVLCGAEYGEVSPERRVGREVVRRFRRLGLAEGRVQFTYGYGPGEINGGAVSFYERGVANGEWHPATNGYVAVPGDVAIYGLSLGTDPSAEHVAIVTDDAPGQSGPDIVNGDGDRTGFSVVETANDQLQVDLGQSDFTLAGYVSPP